MLINEVCKCTNLTKKAVEYYTQKGLVAPGALENGYRDYGKKDVEILRRIRVLRKLGIGMEDIREILHDSTNESLQKAVVRKEMEIRRNVRKDALLRELGSGRSYSEVETELQVLEMEETIEERLLDAFPGYYGRFVCMHFSRFLNEPVKTEEQQAAYGAVLAFLDQMPPFVVPEDVEQDMARITNRIGMEQIEDMLEEVKCSMEKPEDFLIENREAIEWYLEYKESDEYRNSAAGKWMEQMREFQRTSGYTDVFLPAMKQLSPSYAEYCLRMEQADKKFLECYPKAAGYTK